MSYTRGASPSAGWHVEAAAVVSSAPADSRFRDLVSLAARCVGATLVRLVAPGAGGLVTLASSGHEDGVLGDGADEHLVRRAFATGLLARTADGQLVAGIGSPCQGAVLLVAPVVLSGIPRAVLECRGPDLAATPDALDALQALCAFVALALDASDRSHAVRLVAGGIAHDLNNHLTAINGLCEVVLEDECLDAGLRDDLACVRSAGERASVLTQQLLAYSGRQVMDRRVTCLDQCVEDTLPMLRHLVGDDIRVEFVPSRERVGVDIDRQQVANVLLMLGANARDARASSIHLTTSVLRGTEDGDFVRLTMADDGAGMSDDVQAHAFEPFFTTKRQLGHVGLGLPAASGVLGQLAGTIAVVSRDGAGTTVEIRFPVTEALSFAPGSDEKPAFVRTVPGGP